MNFALSAPAPAAVRSRNGAAILRGPLKSEVAMRDWTDLAFLIAVAREGSTTAAGRALGVDQSTVQRRIAQLERDLGLHLVERLASGYRLTEAGAALLPEAEAVQTAVARFKDSAAGIAREGQGVVRLTCPEPIAVRLARSGLIEEFQTRCPDLRIELVLSDRYVDLAKGEADVALRSGDTDDGVLVGRKVAQSLWAVYASADYAEPLTLPLSEADLARHPFGALDAKLSGHRLMTWIAEVAPEARIVGRATSVLGLINLAKSGVGLVPLPMALGGSEPGLVCVMGPVAALTRDWRLLAHPDRRHTRGVSAFFDFIKARIAALQPILTA
jgi:DNA-binding transcriptional LysR family regulator